MGGFPHKITGGVNLLQLLIDVVASAKCDSTGLESGVQPETRCSGLSGSELTGWLFMQLILCVKSF